MNDQETKQKSILEGFFFLIFFLFRYNKSLTFPAATKSILPYSALSFTLSFTLGRIVKEFVDPAQKQPPFNFWHCISTEFSFIMLYIFSASSWKLTVMNFQKWRKKQNILKREFKEISSPLTSNNTSILYAYHQKDKFGS